MCTNIRIPCSDKKNETGNFSFTRDFEIQFWILFNLAYGSIKKNSKLDLKVSRKTKIPGLIILSPKNPDIGT